MVKTNYKVLEQAHKFRLHGVKREGYPATPHATFGTFFWFFGAGRGNLGPIFKIRVSKEH